MHIKFNRTILRTKLETLKIFFNFHWGLNNKSVSMSENEDSNRTDEYPNRGVVIVGFNI